MVRESLPQDRKPSRIVPVRTGVRRKLRQRRLEGTSKPGLRRGKRRTPEVDHRLGSLGWKRIKPPAGHRIPYRNSRPTPRTTTGFQEPLRPQSGIAGRDRRTTHTQGDGKLTFGGQAGGHRHPALEDEETDTVREVAVGGCAVADRTPGPLGFEEPDKLRGTHPRRPPRHANPTPLHRPASKLACKLATTTKGATSTVTPTKSAGPQLVQDCSRAGQGAVISGRHNAAVTSVAHPFLDSSPPLAFAHRGGDEAGLENTLWSFRRASDLGYRYMETDVHLTADGKLVALHDATLDRVTDGQGRIGELTWAEVRRSRVAGREPVPLLAELLEALPETRWNLDVKSEAALRPLLAELDRLDAWDRVCLGAFDEGRVARAQALAGPRLATSLGTRGVLGLRLRSLGVPVPVRRSAVCVQVPVRHAGVPVVDRAFLAAAHRLGMQVHVWTVNDQWWMHRLLDLGVDGIMTDRTEDLRAVLRERGSWGG